MKLIRLLRWLIKVVSVLLSIESLALTLSYFYLFLCSLQIIHISDTLGIFSSNDI